MASIALATTDAHRAYDRDLKPLATALDGAGHHVSIHSWDDPETDWDRYDRVIIRSCWDYVSRRAEFLEWTRRVGQRLRNSPAVIEWNTDKTYLRALDRLGVPIIETLWSVRTGDDLGPHSDWVVKPSISAGAENTARWSDPDRVWTHSEELLAAGRISMTQPYISSVDDIGEIAVFFFGGHYSHAVRKAALLNRDSGADATDRIDDAISPTTATDEQIEAARHIINETQNLLQTSLLYARVDLITDNEGHPRLMELELTEPALYFRHAPGAEENFVAALERDLAQG